MVANVARVGFEADLAYFYLGRAAEELGYTDAASIYYRLSRTAYKCDGFINNCDGLEVEKEVSSALTRVGYSQAEPVTVTHASEDTSSKNPEALALVAEQESPKRDEEWRKQSWMNKGKDAVRAKLKDPKSAEFRNVYFNRGSDGTPMTCGEVNAKNSFSGYSGWQKFISAGSAELTFLEEEVADFWQVWNIYCT
ncbi:PI-PLC domain-containing protein [Luminiphilus syltensis]|nr:hypothetical protein [Luminiphilus syltensis]